MDPFSAESVVVVGVSESETNLAKYVLSNLVHLGYKGKVYAVGPRGGALFGHPIYRSIPEVPGNPELAIILTPARFVADLLAQCGEKGTRWAVIESAGFQELGAEGETHQQEVLKACKKYDIRFVGPNCIGVANTSSGLYTPFVPLAQPFRKGKNGVFAQSGGAGLFLVNRLCASGAGISKFVSMGNKLDLDEADYLAYGMDDPETDVMCFYLEGFKRGRLFADRARQCRKPIILHKSNTSDLSLTIAQSHTAALAAEDWVVDAVCHEAGILRVQCVSEAVTAVKGLCLPKLKGKNLAVLSRSGGHAVMAADLCASYGFNLPPFDQAIIDEAQRRSRAGVIRMGNPMDLGDVFDIPFFTGLVESVLQQPNIDGLVFIYVSYTREREVTLPLVENLAAIGAKCGKPVATVMDITFDDRVNLERCSNYPFFFEPIEAVQALSILAKWSAGAAGLPANVDDQPVGPAASVDDQTFAAGPGASRGGGDHSTLIPAGGPTALAGAPTAPLPPEVAAKISTLIPAAGPTGRQPLLHEALELMDLAGIPTVPWRMTKELDEAVEASEVLGYPVALKAVAPSLLHKSDKGALALGIMDAQSLRNEWLRLQKISGDIVGIVVQKMAQAASRELVVGGKRDSSFGPVVLTGLGGVMVEVLKDVSLRLAPVDTGAALEMLGELAGKSILGPFRGMHAADLEAAARIISQVSHLMSSFPQIREMDLNPVSLNDDGVGAVALDARVLIGEQ